MSTEKIANRQLLFILFMMRTTIVISVLPVLTSVDALQDAWLSAIVSFFGAAAIVVVIGGLGIRFPKQTVVEYGEELLGPWLGKAVSLVFLWAFLHIAATDTHVYASVIVIDFLAQTPLILVIATMVTAAAVAAYKGIETIGRAADLLLPLFLLMIVGSLMVPLFEFPRGLENLQPVLARGMGPVLRGSITPIAIVAQYLVLTMLIPSTVSPKKTLRTALLALAWASLILIPAAVAVIGILGPVPGSEAFFPFFLMVRAIQFSEFLERIEVLTIFAWGFGLFIGVSTFLFCGARGLSQVLGLKDYRPLVGPMAVIWIVLAFHHYTNIFQVGAFFQPQIVGAHTMAVTLIPFGLLWAAYGLRKLIGGGTDGT